MKRRRRAFLHRAAARSALALIAPRSLVTAAEGLGSRQFTDRVYDARGEPLPAAGFKDLFLFWPHGGFLRPNKQPKDSFHRLRNLILKWNKR